jgi:hypothetical protein
MPALIAHAKANPGKLNTVPRAAKEKLPTLGLAAGSVTWDELTAIIKRDSEVRAALIKAANIQLVAHASALRPACARRDRLTTRPFGRSRNFISTAPSR